MTELFTNYPQLRVPSGMDPQFVSQIQNLLTRIYSDITSIKNGPNVRDIATLADDATPSVKDYSLFLTGGTTTITDFDDGLEGQVITVIARHQVTITDGPNIFLSGSANWTMEVTETLTLICQDGLKWYETGRGANV